MLNDTGLHVYDRNTRMRPAKVLISGFVAATLVAAPLTSAFAGWHHHGGEGHFRGLFGVMAAVGVAALAIHAAPLIIMAGIASSGAFSGSPRTDADEGPPRGNGDYPQRYANYGPQRGYPQESQDYPPNGYYSGQSGYGYSRSPSGYYAPPQARNYSSPGYYGNQPQWGYDESPRGYYPSQQNQYYSRQEYSSPPQGYYGPQSRYYDSQPGY